MNNKRTETRPLSLAARLWIAVDRLYPPCANQVFFEGMGSFDPEQWKAAVTKASDANPGTRLVLRGALRSCRWIDSGVAPPIREIHGSGWDGQGSDGAPFLESSFSPRQGPTCEVLLVHGNPARVAFRSHHAIMDGLGVATWAEDVFRALRGEEPLGSEHLMTEYDLLNLQKGNKSKPLPHQYIAPTGKADGQETDMVWKRKTLTKKYPRLLIQLLLLAAQEAWRHADGKVRFGIPVDLRYRQKNLRSTGNLANAIYMDIDPTTTADQITAEIEKRLSSFSDGQLTWEDTVGNYVPVWLMCKGIRFEGSRSQRSGRYRLSGLISNGGRIDIDKFSCDDFKAATLFGIPVAAPFIPFSMSLVGTKNGIEMLLRMPKNMSTDGRLEAALDTIANSLQSIS
ncbi:MAG: hypothetical protein A2176_04075 [Spirochaetes bacterium RBG_13_51_14]|nr:MAG: hypothetical protein A2176_04075 [Spirochaetes bacterium RBG_13_51_14]